MILRIIVFCLFVVSFDSAYATLFCFNRLFPSSQTQFQPEAFVAKVKGTVFKDNKGQTFRFVDQMNIPEPGFISLSVQHETMGFISALGGRYSLPGLIIRNKWIVGDQSHISYPVSARGRGFLSRFFEFAAMEMPEGTVFTMDDANLESMELLENIKALDQDAVNAFKSSPVGSELWNLYKKVRQEQRNRLTKTDSEIKENNNHNLDSDFLDYLHFKDYLWDVYSVWGRVTRKSGFRQIYFPHSRKMTNQRILLKISEPLKQQEAEFLKTNWDLIKSQLQLQAPD